MNSVTNPYSSPPIIDQPRVALGPIVAKKSLHLLVVAASFLVGFNLANATSKGIRWATNDVLKAWDELLIVTCGGTLVFMALGYVCSKMRRKRSEYSQISLTVRGAAAFAFALGGYWMVIAVLFVVETLYPSAVTQRTLIAAVGASALISRVVVFEGELLLGKLPILRRPSRRLRTRESSSLLGAEDTGIND